MSSMDLPFGKAGGEMGSGSSWLILAAAVAATCAVIFGLAWYVSYLKRVAPAIEDVDVRSDDADQRFKRLSNWFGIFYLALISGFVGLAYFSTTLFASWWSSILPLAQMSILCADSGLCLLVALFAGMGLAALWSGPIMRNLWPDAGRFFLAYLSVRRYGCDHDRLCRGLAVPSALIVIVTLGLGANCYVQARSNEIAEHKFFGLHEATFEYSNIKAIETGERLLSRHNYDRDYWIVFSDGSIFDLYRRLPSGNADVRRRFAEVVSRSSGVPITESKGY